MIQTAAMHAMGLQELGASTGTPPSNAIVHSLAEGIAVLAVPTLTAALPTVIFFHCARASAQARRRLDEVLRAQAIGKDMPTG